ncbi:tripartite tricarboxylate transporter TctB family protein [Falsirhodobacter halotolerans]|uniref:tripartite tricarboxylate transporter TctB family protein n=1 Tax=Falsirhodobacter halotolerans TaxID=1146892 RepID=UPI001FD0E4BC|nr:tripartite tricarboxylate transporter TctB family protein [Falsirhodobacter halotolerans]MCJ8139880.1 tripartite tricarboxylate transporter TctB family protein [Falsirhodobacter halotolerans]
MSVDDKANFAAGLLVVLVGVTVAAYAASSYDLGTLRRMGPGMFPMGLGLLMAALGAIVAIGAAVRVPGRPAREKVSVEWRNAVLATVGVIAFGLMIRPLGLILAVLAVVIIPAFADRKNKPLAVLVLAGVLAALAVAIFHWLLDLPMPLLPMGLR